MLRITLRHLARMFPFLTEQQPGHFLLSIHAKPGARVSAFAAPLTATHTEVDLRIAAPPVEGQANEELLRFLDEVLERGLREMKADAEGYLGETSYALVVAADAAAKEQQQQVASSSTNASAGEKKGGKKSKAKEAVTVKAQSVNQKKGSAVAAPFPERVDVTLVRGGTSREKTVLATFPGTRAQLLAILEKESSS